MKKIIPWVLGVTLLEIMLVLAVAAVIIILSVRYYQTSTSGQAANAVLEQIHAISAAADGFAVSSGSFSAVSSSTVRPLMPESSLATTWGGSIDITGSQESISVTISAMPFTVCGPLKARLSNPKYSISTTCPT